MDWWIVARHCFESTPVDSHWSAVRRAVRLEGSQSCFPMRAGVAVEAAAVGS